MMVTGEYVKVFGGIKYYWRAKCSIEITILKHTATNVLEVIPFCVEDHLELPRLYIDLVKISAKISKSELEEGIDKKRESYSRAKKGPFPHDVLLEEVWRDFIATTVIGRAFISTVGSKSFSLPIDLEEVLLQEQPVGLSPYLLQTKKERKKSFFAVESDCRDIDPLVGELGCLPDLNVPTNGLSRLHLVFGGANSIMADVMPGLVEGCSGGPPSTASTREATPRTFRRALTSDDFNSSDFLLTWEAAHVSATDAPTTATPPLVNEDIGTPFANREEVDRATHVAANEYPAISISSPRELRRCSSFSTNNLHVDVSRLEMMSGLSSITKALVEVQGGLSRVQSPTQQQIRRNQQQTPPLMMQWMETQRRFL